METKGLATPAIAVAMCILFVIMVQVDTLSALATHDINVSWIKIKHDTTEIQVGENLTIGETYKISYRINNDGVNETAVNITVKLANETWDNTLREQSMVSIDAKKGKTYTITAWNTAGFAPGNYNITVNASIPEDEDWSNNERTRAVTLVTETGAVPTADSLGVEDASGWSGTCVGVPVNITNVRNGPVQGIRLRMDYNESVLNLTNISNGDLTSVWTQLQLGEDRGTMVIATGETGDAISNGSSGSVVLLNFSVIGSPGDMSPMNMTLIELSDPEGAVVGTAPAKNGTFVVSRFSSIVGRVTYACNGTGIAGVNVNLTTGSTVNTTVTNETGYYNFTDVIPGSYFVNASKLRFCDNSTEVTVIAGETTAAADMMLWLKGDLNGNGNIADAGDVVLILRASVGDTELL